MKALTDVASTIASSNNCPYFRQIPVVTYRQVILFGVVKRMAFRNFLLDKNDDHLFLAKLAHFSTHYWLK